MKENDILTLTIADIGMKGEGIAKHEGHTVFVPFALPDEVVTAKVRHINRQGLVFADLVEVQTASPHRVTPICQRYTRCGGCDLMHADYSYQLQVKAAHVGTTLGKAGVTCAVRPTVPSPQPLGYRNKMMLPFGVVEGKPALGFYREGTHHVVRITKCPLHEQWAEISIKATLSFVQTYDLTVYDSTTGKGLLRHLVARKLGDHIDIVMVINWDKLPYWTQYINAIHAVWPDFCLYVSPNMRRNNVIMGDKIYLRWGNPYVHDIEGIKLEVNPLSFLQVNDGVCHTIYADVIDSIRPQPGSVVVDAYAGVGLLGAMMAQRGATVYNIEIVPEATADADRLAEQNGLTTVRNMCGDSAKLLPEVLNAVCIQAPTVHAMHLLAPYFDAIALGQKTYELRLCDDKRQRIRAGHLVCFTASDGRVMYCRVGEVKRYATFAALFADLGTACTASADMSIEEAADSMNAIYTAEQQAADGVVAIGITPVNALGISVVLDPPRKGCDQSICAALNELACGASAPKPMQNAQWPVVTLPYIRQIVYISCNPATLARDLADLQSFYTIDSVQPYDMFPQTRHVETVVRLSRK